MTRQPGSTTQRLVSVTEGTATRQVSLRIYMLGAFRVSLGEHVLDESAWRLRKAATLVKLLALAPGHSLHREQILDELWPDLDPAAASNNLHQVLHAARRILDPNSRPPRVLRLQGDQLHLAPDQLVWVDVEAFEMSADEARRSPTVAAYQRALDLYTGELLPGDLYEDWAALRRESLKRTHLDLCVNLSRLKEERGDLTGAVSALQQALRNETALEEIHAGLMRLYATAGQRHQALRQYESLRRALAEELDVDPQPDTTALYQEILAGTIRSPRAAAARVSPAHQQHNLPALLTSFVGRERDMAMIQERLTTSRLLTLTGTGGSGKTRLALETARSLVARYQDGIWLVELASLSDPALIAQTLASVLGIAEQTDRPPVDVLSESLRDKELLVLMDNCEHLLDACAGLIQDLMNACPNLSVLATSREPLGIAGEVRWQVVPLAVPDDRAVLHEDALSDAVQLFLDRVRYRQPVFALSEENSAAVSRICRRLDGIPLAIELATARVAVLSVQQIADRLDNALSLLSAGSRTAAPRHQTLRGALDWSYDLLDEPERRHFAALSVFAGGWDLEAAAAVHDGAEDSPVLEVLSRLVDQSLVTAEVTAGGAMRYRMLEPVRQYAASLLDQSHEAESVRRLHAGYFLNLAETANQQLTGPEQARWIVRLEGDHDNLRAALQWCRDSGEPEMGLRLCTAICRFWQYHGNLSEGRRWIEEMLAAGQHLAPVLRANALWGSGSLAWCQGDYVGARSPLESALDLYRSIGDYRGMAQALNTLANVAEDQGDTIQAVALYQQSLELSRDLGDKRGMAMAIGNLGAVANEQGDFERGQTLHEQSLALFRELGDQRGIAITLNGLASVAQEQGDYARAEALLEEGLAVRRSLGDVLGVAGATSNLGTLASEQGKYERARILLSEALKLLWDLGERRWLSYCLEGLGTVAGAQDDVERAARLWGAAEVVREAIGLSIPPERLKNYEEAISTARSRTGEALFGRAWEAGRTMQLPAVIDFALLNAQNG